nr:immunoglobulin light chain junction region [Macaca mulatta]MOV69961.1 immunoglobulin light chain junction region [Macaca mulatta]MOV70441.1 immunoglobulin light chain junction region [Macaca mulatta]MOV70495.1 immunoglobulin light chain junction region [Macaca mulatta]
DYYCSSYAGSKTLF